jgi:hypothetical protein
MIYIYIILSLKYFVIADPWPNYTFSVPDKRLYTLFKGITVTPRFVRASNVSSHSRAAFTRGVSCLCFVRRPLHVQRAYVSRRPPDRAKATARAAPSAPKQSTTPPRPCRVSEASHMTCFCPSSEHTRRVAFSTYLPFDAEILQPSEPPRVETAHAKQHSHGLSSVSVFIRLSSHTQ